MLWHMEHVVMEISAAMEGVGGLGQGKLRVTTERLVFERKRVFGGSGDVTTFPLSTIQQAGVTGLLEKKLTVRAGSTTAVFKSGLTSNEKELKAISDLLQRSIAGYPLGGPAQVHGPGAEVAPQAAPARDAQAVAPPTAWVDELERLAKLHAAGALTDAEFTAAKARLVT